MSATFGEIRRYVGVALPYGKHVAMHVIRLIIATPLHLVHSIIYAASLRQSPSPQPRCRHPVLLDPRHPRNAVDEADCVCR